MKVDTSQSIYSEAETAKDDFNRQELRRCRFLLRRLQFLEAKIRDMGGMSTGEESGSGAFAEWESEALEWVLDEIRFLDINKVSTTGRQGA